MSNNYVTKYNENDWNPPSISERLLFVCLFREMEMKPKCQSIPHEVGQTSLPVVLLPKNFRVVQRTNSSREVVDHDVYY